MSGNQHLTDYRETGPASKMEKGAGSALIALIAVLLIFAVLAAVIIPLVSSSGRQGLASNLATKAYLLAESGYRYAVSQYRHGGTSAGQRNDVLERLGGNYTLDDNQGAFNLTLHAFFYEIKGDANATLTQLDTRAPGTFAHNEIALGNGLKLSIGNHTYTIQAYTKSGAAEDGNVTFTVNLLENIADGTIAHPAVDSVASPPLANGGDLAYAGGRGGMFPLKNGRIRVGYRNLSYSYNDRNNSRFVDVRDPNDPNMSNYLVAAGTPIILTHYARLHSSGVSGAQGLETRREVVYYDVLPLTEDIGYTETFEDSFDDPGSTDADWDRNPATHALGPVAGGTDPVLRVLDASGDKSLITLSPATLQDPFNVSRRSSGGYLSYDAQVKVGFFADAVPPPPIPDQGYFPAGSSIPAYVSAGLSFRLSPVGADYNGYGLSFLRAGTGDKLPAGMAPVQDKRTIVLWQQTNSGEDFQWLAYKDISDEILLETGFEDGWNSSEWDDPTGLWHRSANRPYSGAYAFAYNSASTGDYDTGAANSGSLTYLGPDGQGITLPRSDRITLSFQSWHQTETEAERSLYALFDRKRVQIRTQLNGIPTAWVDLAFNLTPAYAPDAWNLVEFPLADFAGQTVQLRFLFQTGDDLYNDHEGWYIDDVKISYAWPVIDATLAVRLKEAAVLSFTNGGPTPIGKGDRVYGSTSGTLGTVICPPVLSSGTWTGNNAQGVLLLNKVTLTTVFGGGENLLVLDSNATAMVAAFDSNPDPDANVDRKVNVIKVFYADPNGFGTPNSIPTDENLRAYPRLQTGQVLQWPVDEGGDWTADRDYFRLIQWDAVNDGNVTDLALISSPPGEERTVLRHHHPELQSPAMGTTLNQPELGLHSFGDGAANVYFDDFGVQIYIRPDTTFPLQQ